MISQNDIKGRHPVATCHGCHRPLKRAGQACPYCGYWRAPSPSSPVKNVSSSNTRRPPGGTKIYLLTFLVAGPVLLWGYHEWNGRRAEVPLAYVSVLPAPATLLPSTAAKPAPPKVAHASPSPTTSPVANVFPQPPVQRPVPPKAEQAAVGAPLAPSVGAPMAPIQDNTQPRRHEIPFEAYEGSAKRIIVSVTFNDSVTAPMIIDTGAPGLVISAQLAEKLGVFSRDEGHLLIMARGIGGSTPAVRTILDKVQMGPLTDRFVPTTVTHSVSSSFEGLIGMDFTSRYSMKVDPTKKVVEFEELSPDPNAPAGRDERWWRSMFQELHTYHGEVQKYEEGLDRQIDRGINTDGWKRLKRLAEWQRLQAEKLQDKLERYASDNSVPRHWR